MLSVASLGVSCFTGGSVSIAPPNTMADSYGWARWLCSPPTRATPGRPGRPLGGAPGTGWRIDTIAFNGLTRVDTIGHPISDQLHTIERFQRPDLGHIAYTLTVDDPKTYTKPWVSKRTWYLRPQWEIMEYSCEENNKDLREGHIKPGVQP